MIHTALLSFVAVHEQLPTVAETLITPLPPPAWNEALIESSEKALTVTLTVASIVGHPAMVTVTR